MIKVDYEGQKIETPTEWKDIKLAEYEKWFEHKVENQRELVKLVADICKIDAELLLNAPRELFDVLNDAVKFIFDMDTIEPSTSIEHKGVEYFVTPSEDITLGQWVDVEAVLEGESKHKISEMLAIICLPLGAEYKVKEAELRKKTFAQMPCDVILPLLAFFLDRKKKSDEILNHYSNLLALADQYLKDTKSFAASGGGIKQLPIWQRIRYTYLRRSLEKQLSKFSDFSSTK